MNMKNKSIISMVMVLVFILGVVGVVGDTHTSTVAVNPSIVAGGENDQLFTVTACNTGDSGDDDINRFSIYYEWGDFTDFDDVDCKDKTGWNDYVIYDPIVADGYLCLYVADTGNEIEPDECTDFEFTADTPEEECCRELRFETRDVADYWQHVDTDICVDATPPETTKWFDGPQKIDGYVEWIDGVTEVVLDATDTIGPHDAGIKETKYVNILAPPSCQSVCDPYLACNDLSYCESLIDGAYGIPPEDWTTYLDPFQKEEESCHVLFYYSEDGVGNKEPIQVNCFFVDKTPPHLEKDVGGPQKDYILEKVNDGYADWSMDEKTSGEASAKLMIPKGTDSSDFAGVDSFFDVFVGLDTITSLSYETKVTDFIKGWYPLVILGIDADEDGVYESDALGWIGSGGVTKDPSYLGDDSFIACEHPTGNIDNPMVAFENVDAYNDFKCYTPNSDGDGWTNYDSLSYYQSNDVGKIESDDEVAMVKIHLGGNSVTQDGEVAYVDEVKLNGNTIIDEPTPIWITSATDIVFSCADQDPHPSGDEKFCYKVSYDEPEPMHYITDLYCDETVGDDYCCVSAENPIEFNFDDESDGDSLHNLEYYCEDAVEKKTDVFIQYYKVDTTAPEIEKTLTGPQEGICPPGPGDDCYIKDSYSEEIVIDGYSIPAVVTIEDLGDSVRWTIDMDETVPAFTNGHAQYGLIISTDKVHPAFQVHSNDGTCVAYAWGTHLYSAWDDTIPGNYNGWNTGGTGCGSTNTPVSNEGISATGTRYINGGDDGTGNDPTPNPDAVFTITIPKTHLGSGEFYWAMQLMGNTVDTQYPDAWVKWSGDASTFATLELPEAGTVIHIEVTDPEVNGCAVDEVECYYEITWISPTGGPIIVGGGQFGEEGADIIFTEDSEHELFIHCEDALGNEVEDTETFLVDSTPPVTTKDYNPDAYIGHNEVKYIDTVHEIILTAEDEKVGVDEIYYKTVGPVGDEYCISQARCEEWTPNPHDDQGWITYTIPFNGMEESCHIIEYYSEDLFGNKEPVKWQCVFVDKTKPVTTKTYIPEPYVDPVTGYEYIDTVNDVVLEASDLGPHPSGVKETQYMVTLMDDSVCENPDCDPVHTYGDQGWVLYEGSFGIGEESCHMIEYYSVDNVGKKEPVKAQCVFVDKKPPVIEKRYEGPQFPDPIEGPYPHFITSATLIHINAYDDEPHPSGLAILEYRVTLLESNEACESEQRCDTIEVDGGDWTDYEVPFNIPQDSCHLIEIYAEDNVGKYTNHKQCVFVDNKEPLIEKEITGPQMEAQEPVHMYLTDESTIRLNCNDQQPHPVRNEKIHWEMYWKYDECDVDADWGAAVDSGTELDGYKEFTGLADSCHKFIYWCEDALGNTGQPEEEIDIVDNLGPDTEKTVEEPRTEWDGKNSIFYPDETAHCWDETEDEIECWKVTMDTLIILDCKEDPEPHPVGQEEICFKVGWDGDDVTEDYCEGYDDGYINEGYCCGIEPESEFYFEEETEHNLKYYCVDALGNKGVEDEEKFKVGGNKFTVDIGKKWSLISLPIVPLDENIEEILSDTSNIVSVWTYDPTLLLCGDKWCGYSPDGIDNDDLEEMEPGWGYWVKSTDEDEILIGGSLYNPQITPPSRNLIPGWNLIGHYGLEYKESVCGLFSLMNTYTQLPRWTNLLDGAFDSVGWFDDMEPGLGYWILMGSDTPSVVYGPSEYCPWYY